jgi:hypothetical protein
LINGITLRLKFLSGFELLEIPTEMMV